MFKKLLFVAIGMLLVVTGTANAQWTFVKAFPDANFMLAGGGGVNNGIAVDPEGKVWIESYARVDSVLTPEPGVYKTCLAIYVFNPNGTPASFSPIKILSYGGITDTLNSSGYGMCIDPSSGNILVVVNSRTLWKIDYKTGLALGRVRDPIPGYASSIASVAADELGEVFLAGVLAAPVAILNSDFSAAGLVADMCPDIGRTIAVSKDGNDVYVPRFTSKKTYWYHSDNGSLGPYVLQDSILTALVIETMAFHPTTGDLWVGSGNVGSGLPDSSFLPYRWYDYNLTTKQVVDSIVWNGDVSADPRQRGIAFSPTGDTAYVAEFQLSDIPCVQMFVRGGAVYIQPDNNAVPTGYQLSQNYPNPFNPSTTIKFAIAQSGMTTLKVYDVMGREVTTLVNESLAAGSYTVRFDGANLSTGTYLYVLTSGGHRLTGKMLLLK
jgi:hypothetical protein